ncbi:hypothetical protein [Erythrobacter sp. MTPC3]|uniref:hypothetical protein n=1 Tax=Erythrobacter sp. MTPC3 TaxID=3056564 RepID=UPI0036F28DC1
MTNSDTELQTGAASRKVVILVISSVLLLFLLAFLAGFAKGALEHGTPSMTDIGVGFGILAAISATIAVSWKLWPATDPEPIGPSVRKSRNLMGILIGIGTALGVGFAVAGRDKGSILFSNDPVSPAIAIAALIAWLVIVPAVSWKWWKAVDEHEAKAYLESTSIALHIYLLVTPAWWLASRAGWVAPHDPMVVLLIVSIVGSAVWLHRKYM